MALTDLIIAGEFRTDPANAAAVGAAMQAMQADTRNEAGCISYVFSADLVEPGVFRLYERWESQAHLDAHFEAPHMKTFQAALADLPVERVDVLKYDINKIGPVR